jgi:hypothetical protein
MTTAASARPAPEDLGRIILGHGSHENRADGMCLLEAAAWLAGRAHSDHPPCVSPIIGAFGRSFNDSLPHEPRQQLVPLIPRMLGTADDGRDADRLDFMTSWMVHFYAPRWLELAGLPGHAAALRALAIPKWPAADADDAADADADAAAAAADAAAGAVVGSSFVVTGGADGAGAGLITSAVVAVAPTLTGISRSQPLWIRLGSTKRRPSGMVRPRLRAAMAVQSAPSPSCSSAIDQRESLGRTM